MSVESGLDSMISTFHLWWPLAEEPLLLRAAAAYERVEVAASAAAATATVAARLVTSAQSGSAMDRFSEHWAQYDETPVPGCPPRPPRPER